MWGGHWCPGWDIVMKMNWIWDCCLVLWLTATLHLSLWSLSSEGLLKITCCAGAPFSTGLYSESSTAWSSSLAFAFCLVTRRCRTTARFDELDGLLVKSPFQMQTLIIPPSRLFSPLNAGLWKLVVWNDYLHCPRLHCYDKGKALPLVVAFDKRIIEPVHWRVFASAARSGHSALDLDQPLCHLGLPGFLHIFQLLLGRNYMVGKKKIASCSLKYTQLTCLYFCSV